MASWGDFNVSELKCPTSIHKSTSLRRKSARLFLLITSILLKKINLKSNARKRIFPDALLFQPRNQEIMLADS